MFPLPSMRSGTFRLWPVAPLVSVASLAAPLAHAGGIEVVSATRQVVVVLDGQVVGSTPARVEDLEAGAHTVGIRASTFSATVLSGEVTVPGEGTLTVAVDWPPQRLVPCEVVPAPPAQSPDSPDPAPAPVVAGPPAPSGDLYVAADAESALVLLDGEEVGQAPLLLKGVAEGPHRVEVRTACARGHQEVDVSPDVVTRVELALERGQGELSIETMPSRATVLLDGAEAGLSPLQADVECGPHTVEVRSVGFLPSLQTMDVRAFETVPVLVELVAERFGRLSVIPSPVEATVTLDGVVLGTGPRTVDPVSAGSHELVVSAVGYQEDGRAVEVAPDTVTRVEVSLTPSPMEKKIPWPRLVLDTLPAVGGLVLGGLAIGSYREASVAYDSFLEVESDEEAARIWDEQVAPSRNRSIAEGIAAGALLVGSGVLWGTTRFTVGIGPRAVHVEATW